MTPYVTRIAPSPTGDMHLGTARTAYFCWLAAKASGGRFILRIDDTDVARNRQECVDVILQTMDWLGLGYDEIAYQSHRTKAYVERAKMLVTAGFAVELDNGAIALKWHDWMPRVWKDEVAGEIPITDTNIEQIDGRLILLKGGENRGQPVYQFASIIDDIDFGVNFIIRGVDHITNTAKQLAILWAVDRALGRDNKREIKFAHLGLIHKDKKKLSKRDGAASLLGYKEKGYDPEALLNFMLRLGWGPRVDDKSTAVLPRDRAMALFLDGGTMKSSPANFDQAKLDSFDRKYKAIVKEKPA